MPRLKAKAAGRQLIGACLGINAEAESESSLKAACQRLSEPSHMARSGVTKFHFVPDQRKMEKRMFFHFAMRRDMGFEPQISADSHD